MIPAPLGQPLPEPVGPPTRRAALRVAGIVLVVVGLLGAIMWTARYSTLGHLRVPLVSGDRVLELDRAGTYLVFEEFDGASSPQRPSPLEVLIVAEGGSPVEVEPLQGPGESSAPLAYETPLHEGRGLARFHIDEPGAYRLEVTLRGESDGSSAYRPLTISQLAVAEESAAGWLGTWMGLATLCLVPLAGGVGLVVVTRRGDAPGGADGDRGMVEPTGTPGWLR